MNTDHGWPAVRVWRRDQRALLLAARQGVPAAVRQAARAALAAFLHEVVPAPTGTVVGGYWPTRGEPDLLEMLGDLATRGARVAMPVVVREREPVEFWRWAPGTPMVAGRWDIPVPARREPLSPGLVLVPLLGYDDAGYRLGYGSGYYDRTLALPSSGRLVVGVGYACGRLPSIRPQPHDVPMDVIVTEAGARWRAGKEHEPT